jgi:hypothetical protein
MSRVLSVGAIAKELGVERHRVEYIIRSRRIRSCGRVGVAHAYDEQAVLQISKDLEVTAAKWNAAPELAAAGAR